MKGAPVVGNGLGGLPRRAIDGAGVGGNTVGLPILNHGVSAVFDGAGDIAMPFEIQDIRRVKFEYVVDAIISSDVSLTLVDQPLYASHFFIEYNQSMLIKYKPADTTSFLTIKPINSTTINIARAGTLSEGRVVVTEYDVEVDSADLYNSLEGGAVAVTNPIKDLTKTLFSINATAQNLGEARTFQVDSYTSLYWQRVLLTGNNAGATNTAGFRVESPELVRGAGYASNIRCNILQIK